ncbi:uncharacterized protein NDAI_0E00120 [Naumovozyma dairenensis CBS 421]|uniref:RNase III domain-containing protein n=1 Tax=Naumovozyma dairenensis (strain ATCC 10597 / BCRC 20456 / CBS 421 / NBRC 0211 / NRRL Y-12639) TaxID=1071378 RepID=G0WAQ8_NAUDC|nr:hypothetical protein NDAI_0E00120 [Naumovozyma dairenensis CBS 421]CCD24828.1 hypothetical protein NDAI_0E00120 [Naumovozyma dairenensis CBS 421]
MSVEPVFVISEQYTEKHGEELRSFYKVQNACVQLKEAIKIIYANAKPNEELVELFTNGNELEQAIAKSPAMSIASYLYSVQPSFDVESIFEHYAFHEDSTPVDQFIKYPVVSDASLENLAFIHRSLPNMNVNLTESQRTMMSNERLEFLGDSWLGALVAYSLYKKYPFANEGALSKMKQAIVNNDNLEKISKKLGFPEKLRGNIPHTSLRKKDKKSKLYADCVEAYIGALVVDRYSAEFKEVSQWLEDLSEDIFEEMGDSLTRDPLNKNSKGELAEILQFNKLGKKVEYKTLNKKSPFRVEVRLGNIVLGVGVGDNIKEAEQRSAMFALENPKELEKYTASPIESTSKVNNDLEYSPAYDDDESTLALNPAVDSPSEASDAMSSTSALVESVVKEVGDSGNVAVLIDTLMNRMSNVVEQMVSSTVSNILEKKGDVSVLTPELKANSTMGEVEAKNIKRTRKETTNNTQNMERIAKMDSIKKKVPPISYDEPDPNIIIINSESEDASESSFDDRRQKRVQTRNDLPNEAFINVDSNGIYKSSTNLKALQDFNALAAAYDAKGKKGRKNKGGQQDGNLVGGFDPAKDSNNRPGERKGRLAFGSRINNNPGNLEGRLGSSKKANTNNRPGKSAGGRSVPGMSGSINKTLGLKAGLDPSKDSNNRGGEKVPSSNNSTRYDKEASEKLYALLGKSNMCPEYETTNEGDGFYTVCRIKGMGITIGEGSGRSKKISQHIAAGNALRNKEVKKLLSR